VDIGEEWAYRARQQDEVTQVRIMRIGTNRPPRVLIRFMEDRFEGREEWVSPARLKTTWDKVDEWVADDQRWTAIRDASWRSREDPELRAAEMVLEVENLPLDCISTGYNRDNGILFINNVAELSRVLGLDPTELTSCRRRVKTDPLPTGENGPPSTVGSAQRGGLGGDPPSSPG